MPGFRLSTLLVCSLSFSLYAQTPEPTVPPATPPPQTEPAPPPASQPSDQDVVVPPKPQPAQETVPSPRFPSGLPQENPDPNASNPAGLKNNKEPRETKNNKDSDTPIKSSQIHNPVLWHDPGQISSLDLFYGQGGKDHQPEPPFTFESEDHNGTNPKFDVHDAKDKKWRVKLGEEARPEVVASRLMWAMGYYVNDDYVLASADINDLHIQRGADRAKGGHITEARFSRKPSGQKKLGIMAVETKSIYRHPRIQRPAGDDGGHEQLGPQRRQQRRLRRQRLQLRNLPHQRHRRHVRHQWSQLDTCPLQGKHQQLQGFEIHPAANSYRGGLRHSEAAHRLPPQDRRLRRKRICSASRIRMDRQQYSAQGRALDGLAVRSTQSPTTR